MKINITLGGPVEISLGFTNKTIEVPEGSTIKQAAEVINIPNESWTKWGSPFKRCYVNGEPQNESYVLHDRDELLIMTFADSWRLN